MKLRAIQLAPSSMDVFPRKRLIGHLSRPLQALRLRRAGHDVVPETHGLLAENGSSGHLAGDAELLDNAGLVRQLDLEVERARRGSGMFSVLVGELRLECEDDLVDGFPGRLLDRTARVLVEQKRQIDIAGKLDDGLFALVLPETDEHGALTVAERLRDAVSSAFGDLQSPLSVSFGVASFARHGRTPGALLAAARGALLAVQTLERDATLIDSGEIVAAMATVNRHDGEPCEHLDTALALAETVDVRDRGIAGHSQVVGRYARQIGRELGLSEETANRIWLAATLHDIGKVGVSKAALRKSGALTAEEWQAVRRHPEIATGILQGDDLADIREWVLHHHERPDGHGYPHGLPNGEIPLASRIIAVAEAYEAMTSTRRAHHIALSHTEAQAELLECVGTQFDRRVVEAFMRLLERQGLRTRSANVA